MANVVDIGKSIILVTPVLPEISIKQVESVIQVMTVTWQNSVIYELICVKLVIWVMNDMGTKMNQATLSYVE